MYLGIFYNCIVLRDFIHEHSTLHPDYKFSFVMVFFFPFLLIRLCVFSVDRRMGLYFMSVNTTFQPVVNMRLTYICFKKSTVKVPDLECFLL